MNNIEVESSDGSVEDDHEEEESEDDDSEEGGGGGGGVDMEASRNESINAILTNPQVLDCMTCCNSLTIPVFQCENGHIACPNCIPKFRNKCPSCHSLIGSSRCRAIERVLESIKVTCPNTKYGCKATMSYSNKYVHEKNCIYTPCSCPLSSCHFVGSQAQLNKHFSESHNKNNSAVPFYFNQVAHINLHINDTFLVLREELYGVLLVLSNICENIGNVISICCIGPPWRGGYSYDILAKPIGSSTLIRFQNYAPCIPQRVKNPPSTGFLLVPSDSFGSGRELKLDICILGCGKSPVSAFKVLKKL